MSIQVAVKRLDKLSPRDDAFVNEVNTIGCIHHINLVKLYGYCSSSTHKLLVYEFVANSSLDKLLFRRDAKSDSPILEWRTRFKIALQTARGLAYLHEDVRDQRIIHCDIKPENILLDSKMTAKVADFGLSRILNREQTRTMTKRIRGTTGYLAPEWTSENTPITAKIDVFSFGMVLLEVVSGRRNLRPYWIHDQEIHDSQMECRYFPQWAFPKVETEDFLEVVDGGLQGIVDAKQVKRALLVAFWCINENPNQRPTMSKVVQLLEGHIPIERPVARPRFLDDMELGSSIPTSRHNSSRRSDAVVCTLTDHHVSSTVSEGSPSEASVYFGR